MPVSRIGDAVCMGASATFSPPEENLGSIPDWRSAMKLSTTLIASAALAFAPLALAGDHGNMYAKSETIVDIAAGNPDFSTLVAALKAADLVDTLSGDGPFTVFAPTNDAFAKLPEGTVESLLKPGNKDKLTAILTYHVAAGSVPAAEVVKLNSATTVQGSDVTVTVNGSKVAVNDANVVATDIKGSNGIIHVIDSVLLPQ